MRTTSGLWLLGMAEQFKWLELPVADLFEQADIPLHSLANPRIRVPQDNVSRLWRLAERASGNEAIGLLVGQQLGLSGMPGATVGLLQCPSAVAAIDLVMRHQRLIGETSNIRWAGDDSARSGNRRLDFSFFDDQTPLSPHTLDVAMASMTRLARLVEGQGWTPLQVDLRRRVKDPSAHRAFYRCEVKFGCHKNSILIASPSEQHSPQSIEAAPAAEQGRGISDMVAMVLPDQLRIGVFGRGDIARLFAMSEKTLQRRLASEGRRFSDILDEVRSRKSSELLLSGDYTQTEVAFLCGFGDLSSFHHAFKRWFGIAPGRYLRERGTTTR